MRNLASRRFVRLPQLITLVATAATCSTQQPVAKRWDSATSSYDSTATAAAVVLATQRMRQHGQTGLSVDDVKRTREWFTPELYALLVRDMSDPGGVGYLNWDPFTDAQDDVGPF